MEVHSEHDAFVQINDSAPTSTAEFTVVDGTLHVKALREEVVCNDMLLPTGNEEELSHVR